MRPKRKSIEADDGSYEGMVLAAFDRLQPLVRTCRECGCDDLHACAGSFHWAAIDLCSRCANAARPKRAKHRFSVV